EQALRPNADACRHGRSLRRRPAPAHARHLQQYGAGPGDHGPRRLWRREHAGALPADLRHSAEVGGDVRAARLRLLPVLPDGADDGGDGSDRLSRIFSGDGRFDGGDLPRLYRDEHRADLLHRRLDVPRRQPLGLHDQAGSHRLVDLPLHGADRRGGGQHHQRLPRLDDAPADRLFRRHHRVHRAHRLGHAAGEVRLPCLRRDAACREARHHGSALAVPEPR
ncbi:MAG: FIG005935: membrane protein, partial [uncultured Sphingomonadaceae bacterium]